MEHGLEDGEKTKTSEFIKEGKAKSREEQLISRFNSRVNKKIDSGYRNTLEEAKLTIGGNNLGLKKPMLAEPLKKVKISKLSDYFIQRKYNGFRCLVTKVDGRFIAYSRNGKELKAVDHIFEGMELEEGMTLDGELYCHGMPFEELSSAAKKKKESTKNLRYIIYDIAAEGKTYEIKLEDLSLGKLFDLLGIYSEVAETTPLEDDSDVQAITKQYMEEGYEGSILRKRDSVYKVGGRSKDLIKVKILLDEEFEVIDVVPSEDHWGILVCQTNSGETFSVSAPGTFEEKTEILINKHKYIGQYIHVEFPNYTLREVPFHPVAKFWRNKFEE